MARRPASKSMGRRVIGVEREFTVVGPSGPVPFATLRPGLRDAGWALDPGDPLARRAGWGGQVTADGDHAEAATPPIPLAPGCTHAVLESAARGRSHLASLVPSSHHLEGYSTHLNVELAGSRRGPAVAALIARRLALPLMLALDRTHSPGLLVRPRHRRLEVGGEFAAGVQLRAAMVIAIAVTLLAERCRWDAVLRHSLPRPVCEVVPAIERHGWYVDRRAFGSDLYACGRDTPVAVAARPTPWRGRWRTGPTGTLRAGEVLQATWSMGRPFVLGLLDDDEIALGDDLAAGVVQLPSQCPTDGDGVAGHARPRHYGPRRRQGVTATIEAATWHAAVVRLDGSDWTRWLTLAGRDLDGWLDELDAGRHDRWLAAPRPAGWGRRA